MAKIIRCPNCGENVEVPPNPTGQVVTCVACGTALRLKSRKKGELGQSGQSGQSVSDPGNSAMGGSLSGSMTTIAPSSDFGQVGPDDPPALGTECEVCGKTVDPSDLLEDRGRMVCRTCLKKPKATGKAPTYDGLIPFAEPDAPAVRGKLFTITPAFLGGCAALVVYAACQVFLFLYPKPVGSKTFVAAPTSEQPVPSTETTWDKENRPRIEKLMQEGEALKADPTRAAEAKAKYDEVLTLAKGQASGSTEVTRLVNLAEQQSESLKRALEAAASTTTPPPAPDPGVTTPAPVSPDPVVANVPPAPSTPVPAPVVAPEDVALKDGTVFADPEASITDKLSKGMSLLETALGQPGDPAIPHGEEAVRMFSAARYDLDQLKRNVKEDPAWSLANHGTAVGYTFARKYSLAIEYLNRLPSPPDRATVINRAVVLLQLREEKLEAIKMLLGLLESDPEAKDVYAINLLGTALGRYPEETLQQEKTLREAKNAYAAMVRKLNATHPGERRWGVNWVSPRELETLSREALFQRNRLLDLERKLRIARAYITENTGRPQRAAELSIAQSDEKTVLRHIAETRARMTTEEWLTPEQILPVLPDVTAVNSATKRAATQPAAAQ